ncbi:hypothetical protein H5410_020021 [Solanum commersonii]|uniref:Uncharacterized protein n=1 Tax=Solanum commersonii TaxID=4109 RepID=A0A9J5ZB94_SOLCO|nr:hypothetical protein H5410_020021 [Solanum commersonii]
MRPAYCIISFLIISLIIHESTSRSIQQYDNSYKKLFSQFKIARELRGLKGKKTRITPPQASMVSHMHFPFTPPPQSPSSAPTSCS